MKNTNDLQTILDEIHKITDNMSRETALEFLEDISSEIGINIQNRREELRHLALDDLEELQ